MAFFKGTSPASGSYREILTRLVACATSKHISAIVVNAGGTGYTVGDVLTIAHAGGYQSALVEVLTAPAGVIATVAIRAAGAFSNRVASVTIDAGGTGYTTGHIVRLTTGTSTEFAKLSVTAAAGVVSAATVFETGGAYSVAPSAAGATNSDIGLGSGTGLTVTATMTGLIGTTGIGVTGGTGTGATFDLTLTDTGWTAVWNRNDYTFNSITNEKEVILQGTVAGGDEPFVGIRTYTATSGINTRYGWILVGMDSYNSALTFATMPNVGPTVTPNDNTGVCFLMFDNAQSYWFRVTGRKLVAVVKAVGASVTAYTSCYAGLLNPFGTQVEAPYPFYLSGTTSSHNRPPDVGGFFATGLTEVFADLSTTSPAFFRAPSSGTWTRVQNSNNGTAVLTHVVYPVGSVQLANAGSTNEDNIVDYGRFNFQTGGAGVSLASGGAATQVVMPTITANETLLVPATVTSGLTSDNTAETIPRGELDGVFWCPATKSDGAAMAAEDTVTISGVRHTLFQNAHRTERYSYFALEES